MRKRSRVFIPILLVTSMIAIIPSCKDDEPVAPAKLSFAESEITINEYDGVIEIEIVLDKPAPEDMTVEFSLDGTALDLVAADELQTLHDYEVLGDEYLELEIAKGETSGVIEIELVNDFLYEDDETIKIEIEDVDSDAVEITNQDDIEIIVLQETKGTVIVLDWPSPGANGQADMDLILRRGTTIVAGSADPGFAPAEGIFIPASMANASYGAAYTYYEGTLDPLAFEVIFADVIDGAYEPEANFVTFQATYTAVNKNPWTNPGTTKVVQTFQTVNGVVTNISAITVPTSGSRESSAEISTAIKKGEINPTSQSKLLQVLKSRRGN